uniref:Putative secreted protein n=1 Tax=Anopheles darlingi TaxID=43151 RepID=A0A2M4DDH6_ANODA
MMAIATTCCWVLLVLFPDVISCRTKGTPPLLVPAASLPPLQSKRGKWRVGGGTTTNKMKNGFHRMRFVNQLIVIVSTSNASNGRHHGAIVV